jgi:hypothetical protein
MLTSIVLVSSVILASLAVVLPNAPGPGDSFNEGTTCHIGWEGDTDGSATAWKNMAIIELMTGPGSAMITLSSMCQLIHLVSAFIYCSNSGRDWSGRHQGRHLRLYLP